MALYNSNGQINTTSVSGSSTTGLFAADGSINIVLNSGNTGLYHPCGAFNAVPALSSTSFLNTNGNLNVIPGSSPSGYVQGPGTASRNFIPNPFMSGAVVGTPGTLPTGWSVRQPNGMTTNVSAVGTESGINYIDLSISGTASATTSYQLQTNTTTSVPISFGNTYTSSVFMYYSVTTALPNSFSLGVFSFQSNGSTFNNNYATTKAVATSGSLGSRLISQNYTSSVSTDAWQNIVLQFNQTATSVYNFNIRLGWPVIQQLI